MILIISIIHTQILFNKSIKNIGYIKEKVEQIDIVQNNLMPRFNTFIPMQDSLRVGEKNTEDKNSKAIAPTQTLIGYFTITHYDICEKCCGKSPSHPEYGVTATGTVATPYRTIAVDPSIIPYGTRVIIDGVEYVAEDAGGAIKGNKIDICVESHQIALQKGKIKNVPVYIKENV